ncbi:sugar ABC transporter permease [uncultured Sphaerochaeta sp.]|uniref:carbohydrate ABC transporter permease n=1 Tax=uncultured Sphaerochaeta sp. TaxID=886478 RepID=UPI002A0A75F5|nr:sugar ABC transporter permease [uncultured Sphaerochaeta sp.]
MQRRKFTYPIYLVLPALLFFFVFFIIPTFEGFYYSFTDWNTYAPTIHRIGFRNFKELVQEGILPHALANTLIYALFTTILLNLVGLILALALNEVKILGGFFRTIFYVPVVIAPLIVGYIFKAIYNPTFGLLNKTLTMLGMGALTHSWLSDFNTALFAIIATEIWKDSGFNMIIYLSGIKAVNKDLLEQARVDGASYLQRVHHILLPLIASTFTVNLLVSMISSLKVFEIVLVLTGGGPGFETEVINTFVYRKFASGNWGYASAAGFLQTIIIALITFVMLRFLKKREVSL